MKTKRINLPKNLIERLYEVIPSSKFYDVINAFSVRRPTTFRVNTLKITPHKLRMQLQLKGIKAEIVPWSNEAFILKNNSYGEIIKTEEYQNGLIYLQNLSSQIPALVLSPKPQEKILDMTASPGSKTTQMAAMMSNQGEIVANDINTIRLEKLKANLNIQGVTNVRIENQKAQLLGNKYKSYFDKILLDAPCSSMGKINTFNPKSYKDWSLKRVHGFAQSQKEILKSAVKAVKPGGIIVYSTCTLNPEENESVIQFILDKYSNSIKLEIINIPNLIVYPALSKWSNLIYNKQIEKTIRILPSKFMEGFYIAKLRIINTLKI